MSLNPGRQNYREAATLHIGATDYVNLGATTPAPWHSGQ